MNDNRDSGSPEAAQEALTPERTYTPPPVTGYRVLTQGEVDAMNQLKATEREVLHDLEIAALLPGVDQRCIALAKTNLQQGFMWAVRAIARPAS